MAKTQDILDLLDKGFVPYPCMIPGSFYSNRRCLRKEKAEWFMRPGLEPAEATRAVCLGCKRRCAVVNPRGWPELREKPNPARPGVVAFSLVERISVDELLRMKRVLRVDEAAWVLNVSRQTVHRWVEEGVLEQVPGAPVRVTCHSVERILLPVDRTG